MNVLLVHNAYKQSGGEDAVVAREKDMLEQHGNQVELLRRTNDNISGIFTKIRTAYHAPWSPEGYELVVQAINRLRPTLVHAHNLFPLFSPSIYDACIQAGVPVVQTLHNYRTICPGAMLTRGGKICEKCISGTPYQAVLHRCYRNSIAGSLAAARMVAYHRRKKTWLHKVDRYIALTRFAKKKFVEAGFPEKKIAIKSNFYREKDWADKDDGSGRSRGALYVGRLSREKGLATLLTAWNSLDLPLRIAGDGTLPDRSNSIRYGSTVELLGQLTSEQVSKEMSDASFLVLPSDCYEGFPMVLAEAFAHSLPVVASCLGAMAEIVEDGVTGLHFEPGNPQDLVQKVRWLHEHPENCQQMGVNARAEYEAKYTPEKNYNMLMDIYQQAIDEKKRTNAP